MNQINPKKNFCFAKSFAKQNTFFCSFDDPKISTQSYES